MRIRKYRTLLTADGLAQLVLESTTNYHIDTFDGPAKIVSMVNNLYNLGRQTEEYVYLICFNQKQKINAVFELSHGTVNSSFCNAREIFQKALLSNAAHIVLIHNHPSQDPTPSEEDIKTYKKIKEAGKLMGVPLLDSIIVGGTSSVSLMERNL